VPRRHRRRQKVQVASHVDEVVQPHVRPQSIELLFRYVVAECSFHCSLFLLFVVSLRFQVSKPSTELWSGTLGQFGRRCRPMCGKACLSGGRQPGIGALPPAGGTAASHLHRHLGKAEPFRTWEGLSPQKACLSVGVSPKCLRLCPQFPLTTISISSH